MTGKCENALPKLKIGTAQHTLLIHRIKALSIAATLIRRELRIADTGDGRTPSNH
jgi:hypothetical protein